MKKSPGICVDHILDAVHHIESDIAGHNFNSFNGDRRARQLVERKLEVISEACRRLPEQLKAREQEIDWGAIAGIGNVLRRDYHKSQPVILW